jgi:hypothetical protein
MIAFRTTMAMIATPSASSPSAADTTAAQIRTQMTRL